MFTFILLSFIALFALSVNAETEKFCFECKMIVGYVESMIKTDNSTEKITGAVERICGLLGKKLSAGCDNIVESFLPQIIAKLEAKEDPSTVCDQLKLCDDGQVIGDVEPVVDDVVSEHVEGEDNTVCSLCELVVGYVDSFVSSNENATLMEIESELNKVCSLLGGSIGPQCTAFVDSYLPQILQYIVNKTPAQVCELVHACAASTETETPLDNVVAAPESGTVCSLCELVAGYVESFIKSNPNATEQEIEKELDQLCSLLGSSVGSQCTAFINGYLPLVLQYLENKTPMALCSEIGVCSSSVAEVAAPAVVKEVGGSGECSLCDIVTGYIQSYLETHSNVTEAKLEEAVSKVCDLFGQNFGEKCSNFLDQFLPTIIKDAETLSPSQICAKIHLCASSVSATETSEVNVCDVCNLAVGYAEKWYNDNKDFADAELVNLLNDGCAKLGPNYDSSCKQLADHYVPLIVSYFADIPSMELCGKVGAC